MIQRQGDGFPLDPSRVATCDTCGASGSNRRALRLTRRKAALLRIWIAEKQRKLVRKDDVNELIDQIAELTLTHLSAWRCVAAATWW